MIKAILKNNSITLSEFADLFNITRPTLDSYIKSFDYNGYLTNQNFNNVFEFLFSNPGITNEEFAEKYAYIKRYFGKKKLESSSSFHFQHFGNSYNGDNNGLKSRILDIISENEFSKETLEDILNKIEHEALNYVLVKEFDIYTLYHETVEDIYLLLFKTGSTTKKENMVKIGNLYHYAVYKSNSYEAMVSFLKETLGVDNI